MIDGTMIEPLVKPLARLLEAVAGYWEARTKVLTVPEVEPHAEVWKQGEKRKEPENKEEYRDLPFSGPGRFSGYVNGPPKPR